MGEAWRQGWRGLGAGLVLLVMAPLAANAGSSGDGSYANNPQLLNPAAPCPECKTVAQDVSGALPLDIGYRDIEYRDDSLEIEAQDVGLPENAPSDTVPWVIDWSVALRGATRVGEGANSYLGEIAPRFSIEQPTLRGGYSLGGNATVSVDGAGSARLDSFGLDADGRYELDQWSTISASGSISASEDDLTAGGYPANVAAAPLEIDASGEVAGSRRFGLFTLALRGSMGRQIVGDTRYDDASTASNADQTAWTAGAGGRGTVAVTPSLSAFVDAGSQGSRFDAASTTLGARRDARADTLRVGVGFTRDSRLSLEASVGLGRQDFVDPTLGDFTAALYGARVSYAPDETLTLSAGLDTSIAAPGSSAVATAKVATTASGEVAYLVNPWLRLRGTAGLTRSVLEPSGAVSDEWSAGIGGDYLYNAMTDFTADYSITRTESAPDPATEAHKLMVGVTLHR